MYRFYSLLIAIALLTIFACHTHRQLEQDGKSKDFQAEVDRFLEPYTQTFLELYAVSAEAEWASNTLILEGVETIDRNTNAANEAFSRYTGSVAVKDQAGSFLEQRERLSPLQIR